MLDRFWGRWFVPPISTPVCASDFFTPVCAPGVRLRSPPRPSPLRRTPLRTTCALFCFQCARFCLILWLESVSFHFFFLFVSLTQFRVFSCFVFDFFLSGIFVLLALL